MENLPRMERQLHRHAQGRASEKERLEEETELLASTAQQLAVVRQQIDLVQEALNSSALREFNAQHYTVEDFTLNGVMSNAIDSVFRHSLELDLAVNDRYRPTKKNTRVHVLYTDDATKEKHGCWLRIGDNTRFIDVVANTRKYFNLTEGDDNEWELYCEEKSEVWDPNSLCENSLLGIRNPQRACCLRKVPNAILHARAAVTALAEMKLRESLIQEQKQAVDARVKKLEESVLSSVQKQMFKAVPEKSKMTRELFFFHLPFLVVFTLLVTLYYNPAESNNRISSAIMSRLNDVSLPDEILVIRRRNLSWIDNSVKLEDFIMEGFVPTLFPHELYDGAPLRASNDTRGTLGFAHVVDGPIRLLQTRRIRSEECSELPSYPWLSSRFPSAPPPTTSPQFPPSPAHPLPSPSSPPAPRSRPTPSAPPSPGDVVANLIASLLASLPDPPNATQVDTSQLPECYSKELSVAPYGLAAGAPVAHGDGDDFRPNPEELAKLSEAFEWRDGGNDVEELEGVGPAGYYFDMLNARDYQNSVEFLIRNEWVDSATSHVLVKFHLRSLNSPIITKCTIFFRVENTGGVVAHLVLRPLHYKSALGSEEEVLRDFLRVWTYIMTAYYVYLLVTTLYGVARAAMQIGQLRVLLLQGHLLLKVALAALLVISFILHLVLEPAVKSCAECEVDSLRDLAAINYSDLSQLRRPDGRWDAVIAGNTTWLTALEYPQYFGTYMVLTVNRIDTLIIILLVISTMRFFALYKVAALVIASLFSAGIDFVWCIFVFAQAIVLSSLVLLQIVSYSPNRPNLTNMFDSLYTVTYMGVGFANEEDLAIMNDSPITGCLFFFAFDLVVWLCIFSLPMAVLVEMYANSHYVARALKHNKNILQQLDKLKKTTISNKLSTFVSKTGTAAKKEFRPLLASVATMGSSNKLLDVSMGSLLPSRSELSLSGTRKVSKRGSFLTKWKWASLKSATERSENSRPDKKSLETVSMLIARRRTSVSSMRRPSSFFRFTTVKSTDSLNSQDFGCRAPSQQRGTDLTRCQSGVGRFEDIERLTRQSAASEGDRRMAMLYLNAQSRDKLEEVSDSELEEAASPNPMRKSAIPVGQLDVSKVRVSSRISGQQSQFLDSTRRRSFLRELGSAESKFSRLVEQSLADKACADQYSVF